MIPFPLGEGGVILRTNKKCMYSNLSCNRLSSRRTFDRIWCQAELVLTAHPTEINRRTLLVKHQEVARRLEDLEQIDRMGGSAKAGR